MKRRTIITSVLVIVLCLGLISGSTFALFTSESSVNIAVTSGKVKLTASLNADSLTLYSANPYLTGDSLVPVDKIDPTDNSGTLTGTFAGTYYYDKLTGTTFTNGGTAAISNVNGVSTLTLTNVTPGDKVSVNVKMDNESNVKIKYRIRVNVLESGNEQSSLTLFNGLVAKIGNEVLNGVIRVTNWTPVDPSINNGKIDDVPVEIFLPLDAGNEYQEKTTQIRIIVEAVQSNAATNSELKTINDYLAAHSPKNPTMYDAILDVQSALSLATYADAFAKVQDFLWNVDTDRFYVASDEDGFEYKYFKAYTYDEFDALTEQTYSVYAYDGGTRSWTGQTVNVNVGFDAGVTTDVDSVVFDRHDATYGKDFVIRTNSITTTKVTVNAPKDTVKRYGEALSVNIIDVANQSYHEFGMVALIEISKGRLALEKNSTVSQVHVSSIKEDNVTTNVFDEIIVSIDETVDKPKFSRDNVEIADGGTLVVALQQGTQDITEDTQLDFIWLTKQGIFEQIKVSESNEEIKATDKWADDTSLNDTKTQGAAIDIANNIGRNTTDNKVLENVVIGTTDYKVTLNEETRELVVENITDTTATVTPTETTTVITEAVTKTGISDSEKTTIAENLVEETITQAALNDEENIKYARIGMKFYNSFDAAFADAVDGDTIRIIRNCYAPGHDQTAYDLSGKNLTIYVEEDVVLNCQNTQNGKFIIGQNNAPGTLTFDGKGKITFNKMGVWGLVYQMGSGNSIKTIVKNVTIESDEANGIISDGNLTVESGYFKNISFSQGNEILDGYFTTDVTALLPEGKMLTTSDVAGYNYKVTALDAAHANYSVLHGTEYSYYSTLGGVENNVSSGDTVTFIGADLIVPVDSGKNKFDVTNGVIYDLNGHTIQAIGSAYAFYMGAQSKTITMKNGTIDATTQLCEENSISTFVVIAENLKINNAIRTSALSHISNGYYVKDEAGFFTITSDEPTVYTAKIERSGAGRTDYYYTGENGAKYALLEVASGDHVYINVNDSEARVTLGAINDYVDITTAENVDYPEVVSTAGDIDEEQFEGYKRFKVIQTPLCHIGSKDYYSLKEAFIELTNNATIVLDKDIILSNNDTIYLSTNANYGRVLLGGNNNCSLDFNGHTITHSDDFTGEYLICFANGNSSYYKGYFTFKDTSTNANGGMIVTKSGVECVRYNARYYGISIISGVYESVGTIINCNAYMGYNFDGGYTKLKISGGSFIKSSSSNGGITIYGNNINVDKVSITGGIFSTSFYENYSVETHIGDSVNIENVTYYKYN